MLQLKSQSCLADDWGNVSVAEGFNCEYVHHTRFSGEVKLGVFDAEFTLPGGIRKHSGLRHVTLHNVTVGDNCCIENIQNYIANYEIGNDTFIENVDIIQHPYQNVCSLSLCSERALKALSFLEATFTS